MVAGLAKSVPGQLPEAMHRCILECSDARAFVTVSIVAEQRLQIIATSLELWLRAAAIPAPSFAAFLVPQAAAGHCTLARASLAGGQLVRDARCSET